MDEKDLVSKPVCIHLGTLTGETAGGIKDKKRLNLNIYNCHLFKQCTVDGHVPGLPYCHSKISPCRGFRARNSSIPLPALETPLKSTTGSLKGISWAYGMTTVPERRDTLFPRTLESLRKGGFCTPIIFLDGVSHDEASRWEERFRLPVVSRNPRIRPYGNWILALAELWIRNPHTERFALFQDDLVTYPNLKGYLEQTPFPEHGYLNLYTFPRYQRLARGRIGWFETYQRGWGALGLVFTNEQVQRLLAHPIAAQRPKDPTRGHQYIDGGVVEIMKGLGYKEMCHNPSLVQHIGIKSTLGHKNPASLSFRGESFNALNLLEER